jgi:hypothetical protein
VVAEGRRELEPQLRDARSFYARASPGGEVFDRAASPSRKRNQPWFFLNVGILRDNLWVGALVPYSDKADR